MTAPIKRFPFSRGRDLSKQEAGDVYDYLQAQIQSLRNDFNALADQSAGTDYSYAIEQLDKRIKALEASVAALGSSGLPAGVSIRLENDNDTLVIETPTGARQITLALYP